MTNHSEKPPVMTDYDEYLWAQANHHRAYLRMGAHEAECDGVSGTYFAVWAPNAESVSVIGDFNEWKVGAHPLTLRYETGVWGGFIPNISQGSLYKYAVKPRSGNFILEKADPYGFASELRPHNASIVWNVQSYAWQDQEWMAKRSQGDIRCAPVNVYECHLGSWKLHENGNWYTYRELAETLVPYVKEMGYTHVEFMPITEHPFDGSWGYQAVGYFAPTSRFGTPDDFKYLVDCFHRNGIGVILDWVPAHFPTDSYGLARFDGTCLYEHADPRQGYHPQWGTYIFNYSRNEVRNFLLSSAVFWLDVYHIDGLRVDAVASMLYRDYGRENGEWIPNQYGGRDNFEAVSFLQHFNSIVRDEFPGCFTCAEESTAWPRVTGDLKDGGLGFTLKWNMGWMNDTLSYMRTDPIYRSYNHNRLTFGMMYQYSENFMLPLSHDEIVYGKRSLLNKMPGDWWRQRAQHRLLLGYMMGYPGKKLLFMGGEFGQWNEWNANTGLDWHLLENPDHRELQAWSADLNGFYKEHSALWEQDNHPAGFRWNQCDDHNNSVFGFLRFGAAQDEAIMFILNCTPVPRDNYRFGVPWPGEWQLMLNSDAPKYGGSGYGIAPKVNAKEEPWGGYPASLAFNVPPFSCLVFRGVPTPVNNKVSVTNKQ